MRGAGREKAESTYEKRRKERRGSRSTSECPVEIHKMMKLHSLPTGESYVDLLNRLLTAEFGDDPTVMADELARRTRDGGNATSGMGGIDIETLRVTGVLNELAAKSVGRLRQPSQPQGQALDGKACKGVHRLRPRCRRHRKGL